MKPSKFPTSKLDLVEDVDLIVEYIDCWIGDAEVQIKGDSFQVGPRRLDAVTDQVVAAVRMPLCLSFHRRKVAKTVARYVYGMAARKLDPRVRSHGQVKI